MTLTYMRGDDEMVEFAPHCYVQRSFGQLLGLLSRPPAAEGQDNAKKGGKRGTKKGGKKCEAPIATLPELADALARDASALLEPATAEPDLKVSTVVPIELSGNPGELPVSPFWKPTPEQAAAAGAVTADDVGLTDTVRRTIRLLKKLGGTPREIAAQTGFSIATIKAVLAERAA